ncbi:recombinase family protein [Nocardiopsis sp. CNS-639]|uniref:recombinase family protein n=1 Tax=Nocardiopsis sp. CNS-639 TaxID=1169153 RepID=UPI000378F82A|nr:recombinase family protein [Nocardiopsis sp. CNS-639]
MHVQHTSPIDLSDLPGFHRVDHRPRRSAFLGRVSTKDQQDPRSSIPRQVLLASALLEEGEQFASHWWDVESGMLPPQLRGLGDEDTYTALGVNVPRNGGLGDLLEQAPRLGITRVIAERSDRVARAMLTSLTVEYQLDRDGIDVLYANEPRGGTKSGQLRTRRYSQVDAEILRHSLMEMSTGGQVQHALNGFQHGPPCYGYVTVVDEEATATLKKTRFGLARPKRRLALHPDPRQQETVREVFRLRREEKLGNGHIRALLASAPELHPLEQGAWTNQRVLSMLAQPKYTGYQVYNRTAKRTDGERPNPICEWVWSTEPAHPAIITPQEWYDTQLVTARLRQLRADTSGLQRIRQAAQARGLGMALVRSSHTHVVYALGGREVVVPRGKLPAPVVDQIVHELEGVA